MKFYEHHTETVIGASEFWARVRRHWGIAVLLFLATLLIGTGGFCLSGLSPLDAVLDSTMLMSGMGPVKCGSIEAWHGKIFASLFALFCGIVFIVAMSIALAPFLHRLLHATFLKRSEHPTSGLD